MDQFPFNHSNQSTAPEPRNVPRVARKADREAVTVPVPRLPEVNFFTDLPRMTSGITRLDTSGATGDARK